MFYTRIDASSGILALDSAGAHFQMDTHIHEEFVIAGYRAGTKHFTCFEEEGFADAGDFLLISPDCPHSARSVGARGCSYQAIYPTFEQYADLTGLDPSAIARRLDRMRKIGRDQGGRNLTSALALIFEEPGNARILALAVFLNDLLSLRDDDMTAHRPDKRLRIIWDRLYEEPGNEVDLQDLADDAGMSREHLCRSFRKVFGISPFQLLRARRTSYARDLIEAGTSLSTAAVLAGFSDQSHMTRWFRRIYGTSPKTLPIHQ